METQLYITPLLCGGQSDHGQAQQVEPQERGNALISA